LGTTALPPLPLTGWRPTRDTVHGYARLLGKLRAAYTPPHKHWWHVSLRAAATGLTTTQIPAPGRTFELLLDLVRHELVISTDGERRALPLRGQSLAAFSDETLTALARLGIEPPIDRAPFRDDTPGSYDADAAARFWQALAEIDAVFKRFKAGVRGTTGPVQLFPHHFDLSMNWFSGRRVPGVDPDDAENADEQMNFGFSTGDDGIPEPYFYITAYPAPAELFRTALPKDSYWHSASFQGAVLPYEAVRRSANPADKILEFLQTVQQAGERLMTGG
jgi:hypothetical protein